MINEPVDRKVAVVRRTAWTGLARDAVRMKHWD